MTHVGREKSSASLGGQPRSRRPSRLTPDTARAQRLVRLERDRQQLCESRQGNAGGQQGQPWGLGDHGNGVPRGRWPWRHRAGDRARAREPRALGQGWREGEQQTRCGQNRSPKRDRWRMRTCCYLQLIWIKREGGEVTALISQRRVSAPFSRAQLSQPSCSFGSQRQTQPHQTVRGEQKPSAPGEQAAAAPGREDQRWRRAPGTAGREQAERAWSSRDGIKNTLARSAVALSENNPPKCVKMFIL